MLTIPRSTRVFLATEPTDLRKGFDGLFALVQTVIGEDPFSGHLFVFRNQRRDRLKVLWWDRDGLAIYYKRLERGSYQFPTDLESRLKRLQDSKRSSHGSDTSHSKSALSGSATLSGSAMSSRDENQDEKPSHRCEIRADELALLLEGIDLASVKRRPRYERPTSATVSAPSPLATSSS